MHIQDNRYDASYNFIQYSDKGPWSVRFTAWYVAGLLQRNKGDDASHAEAALKNMLVIDLSNSNMSNVNMNQTCLPDDIGLRCALVRYIQALSR